MSIPTGGYAALLVLATLAFAGCGSDEAQPTATTVVTVPATVTQESKPTTTQKTQTTAPATTTTQKTQKTQTTTPATTPAPSPKPAPAKETKRSVCEPIGVGLRDGAVDTTYGRITQKSNLSCAAAAYVVAQWGAQQIGIDKALLPSGWGCSSSNVCRGGKQSVTFVLETPQE